MLLFLHNKHIPYHETNKNKQTPLTRVDLVEVLLEQCILPALVCILVVEVLQSGGPTQHVFIVLG